MKKSLLLSALVIAILLMGVAYASAETATITKVGTGTTAQTAADTVSVKATVNPKLVLAVTTPSVPQTVDFGQVEPGNTYASQTVSLNVESNKKYDVSITKVGDTTIGLGTTLANSLANDKTGGTPFTDVYSLNVPWTTDPGAYTATVQYTVVQN